jgi:hypothetical protein
MRAATSPRLLLPALGLLAGACDDSDAPLEPPVVEQDASAVGPELATLAGGRWAAGYLLTENATAASYTPPSNASYNYGGGAINVRGPDGTTGRYVVTFTGLSAALGGKNTLQVSAFGTDNTFCKAMAGSLSADKVEVRCYRTATGAPVNATFSLAVVGRGSDRAFAFANQPTATAAYTATNAGTWNPAGTTIIQRYSAGLYKVTFKKLALPSDHAGNIQVHAVSSAKAHCKLSYTDAGADLALTVQCYLPTGNPADAKFNVLFQSKNAHVAYAFAERADLAGEYDPSAYWSHNPSKGPILVWRRSKGIYEVFWTDADQHVIDRGNVQVMDFGENNYGHCKPFALGAFNVGVRCFAPNGTLADIPFTILLGS